MKDAMKAEKLGLLMVEKLVECLEKLMVDTKVK
jgi:hypothetical protein